MNKNIVLIDADSLCFLGKKEDTIQQIIEKVDYKIQAILEETNADYYALFVSKGKYFRHVLKNKSEKSGSYKSNRKYSNQNYNRVIKEYLIAQYNAFSSPGSEADDVIKYFMNQPLWWDSQLNAIVNTYPERYDKLEKKNKCVIIMAAVDKDLLQGIAGKHLNYNKKLGPYEWGMEWVETSESQSLKFKWKQLLMGDSTDGVIGIPKIGEKKAESYLNNITEIKSDTITYSNWVFTAYLNYFGESKGIYEFQKNYRLLHLLETDEDWLREVGYLPELPKFLEVNKLKSIEETF